MNAIERMMLLISHSPSIVEIEPIKNRTISHMESTINITGNNDKNSPGYVVVRDSIKNIIACVIKTSISHCHFFCPVKAVR